MTPKRDLRSGLGEFVQVLLLFVLLWAGLGLLLLDRLERQLPTAACSHFTPSR